MVSWKSKDGAAIEGVLHKPANFDSAKKYPLLVVIHGGPTASRARCLRPRTLLSDRSVPCERRGRAGTEIYADTSPITNIRNAKTPTLIQHGDKDKRVPPPNAFELYRGLQDAGVPSQLVLYNGFGHPITKPKSNRAVLQHNLDWFSHYIWGEPIPADSPLRGKEETED